MSTRSCIAFSRSPALALAATALLGAACADNIKTDFPPGLDPIDAVNLATCPSTTTDSYPETLAFHSVTVDQVVRSYACGYIKRPVADVWAAGKVPQSASEASITTCSIALDVEPGYDASWRFHNTKTDVITVWFEVTWRSGTLPWPTPAGGPPLPLTVAWRFQKTDGTAYIQLMEGSVKAYEVPGVVPAVTKLEFIRYVNAARSPPPVVEGGIQNHYDNILAQLNSTPFTNVICTGP